MIIFREHRTMLSPSCAQLQFFLVNFLPRISRNYKYIYSYCIAHKRTFAPQVFYNSNWPIFVNWHRKLGSWFMTNCDGVNETASESSQGRNRATREPTTRDRGARIEGRWWGVGNKGQHGLGSTKSDVDASSWNPTILLEYYFINLILITPRGRSNGKELRFETIISIIAMSNVFLGR